MNEVLTKWEHPVQYDGYSPDGDYVIYSRHRDSAIYENTNYRLILRELCDMSECVYDFRVTHWAVGWVEYIIVPANSCEAVIARAAEIVSELEDYPVLDDMTYSEDQYAEICDYWGKISVSDRIEYCRDNGTSVFAARRNCIPENVYDELLESFV